MQPQGSEPPKRGLTNTTMRGAAWTLSGTGVEAVLQLLVLAILARLVTPEAFGLVSTALIIVHFTAMFSDMGVGPAIVQRPELHARHLESGFTLTLIFGALAFGLLQLLAPVIANLFLMPTLTSVLRVVALVFLARSVSVVAEKLLQRDLKFRLIATIGVASYGVGFGLVGVSLALLGHGVWALVAAYLTQTAVAAVSFLVKSPHRKAIRLQPVAVRELLTFGGGFTLSRIFNQIAVEGDNLVVGRWLGAEALGVYGRAYQLMTMPAVLFGKSLDKVLFPAMAKLQESKELLGLVYRRGVALIALTVLPASAVLCVLAPEIVAVLLGPQWTAAIVPLQIFAVGMLFRTSYKMSDSLARATGAVYRRAWRQMIYAGSVVGGAWIGHHWGVNGVTLAVLTALAVNFVLMAQLSLSLTGLTWSTFIAINVRSAVVAVPVGGGAWFVANAMRGADLPPIIVLLAGFAVAALVGLSLVRTVAPLTLGQEGLWIVRALSRYLPQRYRLLIAQARWLKG